MAGSKPLNPSMSSNRLYGDGCGGGGDGGDGGDDACDGPGKTGETAARGSAAEPPPLVSPATDRATGSSAADAAACRFSSTASSSVFSLMCCFADLTHFVTVARAFLSDDVLPVSAES